MMTLIFTSLSSPLLVRHVELFALLDGSSHIVYIPVAGLFNQPLGFMNEYFKIINSDIF